MKKANPLFSLLPIAYFALASLGCKKIDSLGSAGKDDSGADGKAASGGVTGTGGTTALGLGGMPSRGGTTAPGLGGMPSSGGTTAPGLGGVPSSGGSITTTGTGGTSSTGGASSTGGSSSGAGGNHDSGIDPAMCQVPTTTPGPFSIGFEFRNNGAAPVFLHTDCGRFSYNVSSCTSGYTDQVAIPVFCPPCICGFGCVACGACAPDIGMQVDPGMTAQVPWDAFLYVEQLGQSCSTRVGLPAGLYRVSVAIYATRADAIAQTNPLRTLTVDFPLSSATTLVEIVNSATAIDGGADGDKVDLANSEIPIRDGAVSETNPASCGYLNVNSRVAPPAFNFSVALPDGSSQSCSSRLTTDGGIALPYWPGPITSEISGRVTAVSGTELSVDTCEAGTGCSPTVYRFSVAAPGLTLTVPIGRLVSVWWWLYYGGWSCGQLLVISDSTSGTVARVWLAGSDSAVKQPFPAPFSVAREELFCNPSPSIGQGCGGNDVPPDDYAFQFTPRSGDPPLVLATGETGTLALTVGSGMLQYLTIHNLRSYQTLNCDDYSNWAWWAIGHAGTDGAPDAGHGCVNQVWTGGANDCSWGLPLPCAPCIACNPLPSGSSGGCAAPDISILDWHGGGVDLSLRYPVGCVVTLPTTGPMSSAGPQPCQCDADTLSWICPL